MVLVDARGGLLEMEAGGALGAGLFGRGHGQWAHGCRNGRHTERALEHLAPVEARGDDISDREIAAGIAADVFGRFEGLRPAWHL